MGQGMVVGFNPRAREGRDRLINAVHIEHRGVSIHAPVRGATRWERVVLAHQVCFNPRAREGRDLPVCTRFLAQYLFQSTRP